MISSSTEYPVSQPKPFSLSTSPNWTYHQLGWWCVGSLAFVTAFFPWYFPTHFQGHPSSQVLTSAGAALAFLVSQWRVRNNLAVDERRIVEALSCRLADGRTASATVAALRLRATRESRGFITSNDLEQFRELVDGEVPTDFTRISGEMLF